jgi:hypothetical protein
MHADWGAALQAFAEGVCLELCLAAPISLEKILYLSSPFEMGITKSSFKIVMIHSDIEDIRFSDDLERVMARRPITTLIMGRKTDGWYYLE